MALWGEWECSECGYIAAEGRRPARCPQCGAPAEAFDFFEYEDEEIAEADLDDESLLIDDTLILADEEDEWMASENDEDDGW